jgi:hypothetical protein
VAELEIPPDPVDVSAWTSWAEWGLGWWSSWWTGNRAEGVQREEDFRSSMRELYGYLWQLMDQFARLPAGEAKTETARLLCRQLPRWGRYVAVVYGDQATALRVLYPGQVRAELPVDAGGYCAVGGPELAPAVPIAIAAAVAIVAYVASSAYECRVRAGENARILEAAEKVNSKEAIDAVARAREADANRPSLLQQAGQAAQGAGYGAAAVVKHLVEQLGDRWATAIVSVSGHANPGHVETAGWANDYVQVSVTIATYKAAAT